MLSSNELEIEKTNLQAGGDINIESQSENLTLTATELYSLGNIQLKSPKIISITEQLNKPSITVAKENITIEGTEGIEIKAFENVNVKKIDGGIIEALNQNSILQSGGDFSLISDKDIIANARISSGGNFSTESGNFSQPELTLNGIISSNGDVSFGDYTGSSLKVEAKGSIRGGDITITKAGTFSQNTTEVDPDIAILNAAPALILKAGVENLQHSPDNTPNNFEGTDFVFPESSLPVTEIPGSIEVGNITTALPPNSISTIFNSYSPADSVVLSAEGEIKTGDIKTAGTSVKLKTIRGNIAINIIDTFSVENDTINNSDIDSSALFFAEYGGGNVNIQSGGIFRAQGTFLTSFVGTNTQEGSDVRVSEEASIRTLVFLGDDEIGGNINIEHKGEDFIESYLSEGLGESSEKISGTAGRIFISGGTNNAIYGSLIDEELYGVTFPSSNRIEVTSVSNKTQPPSIIEEPDKENPDTQDTPNNEVVQRQLNKDKENQEVCSPQNQTVAFNKPENTRGGASINNSQSSSNNPCQKSKDSNNILKVNPDNRLDSSSVLPLFLYQLGQNYSLE